MKLAYTIPEAVSASGISRSVLYRYIQAKTLPVVKVGTRTVIRVQDLQAFIDDRVAA